MGIALPKNNGECLSPTLPGFSSQAYVNVFYTSTKKKKKKKKKKKFGLALVSFVSFKPVCTCAKKGLREAQAFLHASLGETISV
ncbi:MAG: hypothetical protein KTM48_01450, partial [Wolbachia endosymbiont of Pissodes strobi]|nr:hypothetical protein [Wolbachia endosymbiont of Pissodes strobi]